MNRKEYYNQHNIHAVRLAIHDNFLLSTSRTLHIYSGGVTISQSTEN
jgi:hypothetical protein